MCAPEIGPNIVISTNRIAAVAAVSPSSAMASFPCDRFAAMIPEPMTQANKKTDPTPSAASRRASGPGSGIRAGPLGHALARANLAQAELVEAFRRQLDQQRDASAQIAQRLL